MDDEARKKIISEQLIKQHHGEHQIIAKYVPKYPDSAEREYVRLVNTFMSIEGEELKKNIPELKRIIQEGDLDTRLDDNSDNDNKRKTARQKGLIGILRRIEMLFESIESALKSAFDMFGLSKAIHAIAKLDEKLSIREWKKTVKKTFGINLLEDYYKGDFYQKIMEQWISDNVDLIRTIPRDSLGKIKQMVYENYIAGRTSTNIVSEMQRQYGMDKHHAKFIARDQTAKLNAKITQQQQRDAGITRYEWSSVGDQRVRDCHKELDGKVFSWNDPPEMWYYRRGRKIYTGRHCHPGEDYQCRCRAMPVFDMDEFDVPV